VPVVSDSAFLLRHSFGRAPQLPGRSRGRRLGDARPVVFATPNLRELPKRGRKAPDLRRKNAADWDRMFAEAAAVVAEPDHLFPRSGPVAAMPPLSGGQRLGGRMLPAIAGHFGAPQPRRPEAAGVSIVAEVASAIRRPGRAGRPDAERIANAAAAGR
jgi:hypothetical protein